jgi:transposase
LTSTYFEADPPFAEGDKRCFGYSRDHRPDCVQIVIAPRLRGGRLWW